MNDKPTDNRIFTGSDAPFSAEQVGNLLKSKEFGVVQNNRIKDIVGNTVLPQIAAARRSNQIMVAIDLIRATKDGNLMADILKCRFAGYSHKKIAKTLMKSEADVPYFPSLAKAIKFVENNEKEGLYRVKVQLSKQVIIPGGV